jgi:hypothetical protein
VRLPQIIGIHCASYPQKRFLTRALAAKPNPHGPGWTSLGCAGREGGEAPAAQPCSSGWNTLLHSGDAASHSREQSDLGPYGSGETC